MKTMLITGASGMLGSNLAWYFRDRWSVTGTYLHHAAVIPGVDCRACDNRDVDQVHSLVQAVKPDLVIHCVANTNMDAQEDDPNAAHGVNVQSTANVIQALEGSSTRLVYISTDAVYSGVQGPYAEAGDVRPLSVYGRTKLEAERLADAAGALSLRTNLYGWNVQDKLGLAEWFLKNLKENGTVNGFGDIWFSGIYTMAFAGVVETCLEKNLMGVYNCASRDGWTKFRFGREIAVRAGYPEGAVKEINSEEAHFKAPRGRDMRLDVGALEHALGQELPTMAESLDAFMADRESGLPRRIGSAS